MMSVTDELEHYMTACSRLKTENARLQAALTEAEAHLKTARWVLEMDDPRLLKALQTIERLIAERDGYKALAERCTKELAALARRVHHKEGHPVAFKDCQRADCYWARAAMTPEEATERERQG